MWKKASADGEVRGIKYGATLRFALLKVASTFARLPRHAGDASTMRVWFLRPHCTCSAPSAASAQSGSSSRPAQKGVRSQAQFFKRSHDLQLALPCRELGFSFSLDAEPHQVDEHFVHLLSRNGVSKTSPVHCNLGYEMVWSALLQH